MVLPIALIKDGLEERENGEDLDRREWQSDQISTKGRRRLSDIDTSSVTDQIEPAIYCL